MAFKSLTAANSVLALAVPNVFPAPQLISGWASDDAFSAEARKMIETVMGVDGKFHGGKIFESVKMGVTLLPDTDSVGFFYAWQQYMDLIRDVAPGSGSIILPSVGQKFVLDTIFFTSTTPFPGVKKILEPMKFQLEIGTVTGVPI